MQILQLSTALPRNKYSTEELMQKFPCKLPEGVKQNVLNLGVSSRHLINQPDTKPRTENLLNEDELVDLCSEACQKALAKTGLSSREIDYLITTYDANAFLSPGLSHFLVPRLELDPFTKHVSAQGVASTAFPKALELAENHLAVHPGHHVLICVSGVSSYWFQNQVHGLKEILETSQISRIEDKKRKQFELRKWIATIQFFLFGDGVAAAVVANKKPGLRVRRITEVTNLGKMDYMAGYSRLAALDEPFKFGFYSYLDREIPKLGVEYTDLALRKLLGDDATSKIKAVKNWAVHTGSEKILDALAEHHGIEPEKLQESHQVLNECGNLAGASLPFILERIVSNGRLKKGDNVLMVGYGWGFSSAACLLENM
jgi:predicted naringenin-chalcone synthase